jgi:hypothetical protein
MVGAMQSQVDVHAIAVLTPSQVRASKCGELDMKLQASQQQKIFKNFVDEYVASD